MKGGKFNAKVDCFLLVMSVRFKPIALQDFVKFFFVDAVFTDRTVLYCLCKKLDLEWAADAVVCTIEYMLPDFQYLSLIKNFPFNKSIAGLGRE